MFALRAASLSLAVALSEPEYNVLLIGDWGGDSDQEPTTAAQNDAALRMGELTAHLQSRFVLLLGDNFYHYGVTAENAEQRFEETFERCFSHESLESVPFYAIAGNHDHRGDVQVQVDFTGQGTGRWQMPALNYVVDETLPDGKSLRVVLFDSVEARGQSYMEEEQPVLEAASPAASQAVLEWVEERLAESEADYLFTAAHYPIYSGCPHGNVMLHTGLPALLEKYGVQAHLSGHDHCMQHIEENGRMHVQSGAGSDNWYKFSQKGLENVTVAFHIAADNAGDVNGGFTAMSFSSQGARFTYYGNDGSVLFTSAHLAPRARTSLV